MKKIAKKLMNKRGQMVGKLFQGAILSVFVIGVLIMLFILAGNEMKDATTDTTAITAINDTVTEMSNATSWLGLFIIFGAIAGLLSLVVVVVFLIQRASGGKGGSV